MMLGVEASLASNHAVETELEVVVLARAAVCRVSAFRLGGDVKP